MRILALLLLLAACSRDERPAAPPQAAAPVASPEGSALTGRVLETFDASKYTYLRLSTASGERWAAVPTTRVEVGAEVTLEHPMVMRSFTSKTLGRTFDEISFASGIAGAAAAPSATAPSAAAPFAGAPLPGQAAPAGPKPSAAGFEDLAAWAEQANRKPPAAADKAVGKPAAGGTITLSALYAQRTALEGKVVRLRGKVSKYTPAVMKKNWVHLRDGSGTPEKKDDDVAITTTDSTAVGDEVSVEGTVRLSRDLGSGYFFPVLIEDAKLVPIEPSR